MSDHRPTMLYCKLHVHTKEIIDWLRVGWSGDQIPLGARFSGRPDWPWGPHSLLFNGYRVFLGGKERPGRAADHSPPSSAEVLEE
jgi:hypothetical protein